jgi:hypothetical protein
MAREQALEIHAQDVAYIDALRNGEANLPEGRRSQVQHRIHTRNLQCVA